MNESNEVSPGDVELLLAYLNDELAIGSAHCIHTFDFGQCDWNSRGFTLDRIFVVAIDSGRITSPATCSEVGSANRLSVQRPGATSTGIDSPR